MTLTVSAERASLPIGNILLFLSAVFAILIMVCGYTPEETNTAPAVVAKKKAELAKARPTKHRSTSEAPAEHAFSDARHKTTETLDALDEHLRLASLEFRKLDAALTKIEETRRPKVRREARRDRPDRLSDMKHSGLVPPPPTGPPSVQRQGAHDGQLGPQRLSRPRDSGGRATDARRAREKAQARAAKAEAEADARALWLSWRRSWLTELKLTARMLPNSIEVNRALAPGFQAVTKLVRTARSLPRGTPPSAAARANWLRKLQEQSAEVRRTLADSR